MYVPVFQNWFHYRNPKRSEASWSSLKFNKVPGMGRFLLGLKFHQTGGCGNITYAARNRIRSIATADTSHTSKTGSFYKGAPVDYDIQTELLEADEYPWDPPPGLPEGWIEVVDPEEPEEVREYVNT